MAENTNKKNYVGSGWERTSNHNGESNTFINISLKLELLKQLPVDNYGNIKLVVGKRRSADERTRASHWVAEDTYVPKNKTNQASQETGSQEQNYNQSENNQPEETNFNRADEPPF